MTVEMSISNLITKAARVVGQEYQRACAPLGITPPQAGIVWILSLVGSKTQVEIAQLLHLEKTNVNAMVKKLQAAGFVNITRSTTDKRKSDVMLTGKGHALSRDLMDVDRQVANIFGKLADNDIEREVIRKFLHRIVFEM